MDVALVLAAGEYLLSHDGDGAAAAAGDSVWEERCSWTHHTEHDKVRNGRL